MIKKARAKGAKVVTTKEARFQKSADSAVHHRKTRAARSHEISHDYVEVIADLIQEGREARVVDIARRLGVTHVTVNRTVARLQKNGLVSTERYRAVFLTPAGNSLAAEVKHRHQVVLEFLRSLGIREETALADAEGIEHYVSQETLRAFEVFLKKNQLGNK